MATATLTPETAAEQRFVLPGTSWDEYVAINDSMGRRRDVRLIFLDGRLTRVTKSGLHQWLAECLGTFTLIVAAGCGIECDSFGSTTFRRKDGGAGAEGDKAFYFGANASRMRGRRDIDLDVDPAPDLAIEVEVTNPGDEAMKTWGRLGVPEVWRFDAERRDLTIWRRRNDGGYERVDRSILLPLIEPREAVEQLGIAEAVGMSRWATLLMEWVRGTVVPRGR